MAAIDIGARNVPPVADSLDDLFDYDVSDVFRDVDTNMEVPTSQKPVVNADGKENTAGLGIDEQIKVVKKRAPVVKLDENRFGFRELTPLLWMLKRMQAAITGWSPEIKANCEGTTQIQGQRP